MEDGNVHELPQALLDDEAFRRLDVLEVDAAEGGPEIAHAVDEGVRILRVDLEIDGIHVGEALEENRLALHHRLRGERAEIAETEDRRAVRDHRHHVGPGGVVEGQGRVLGDRQHRHRDARRIGERQVALGRHGLGRHDFELAGAAMGVELQRLLVGEGRAVAAGRALIVCHGIWFLFWCGAFPEGAATLRHGGALLKTCPHPPFGPYDKDERASGFATTGQMSSQAAYQPPETAPSNAAACPRAGGPRHADDGAIRGDQGRQSGQPAVLPDGRFLRAVLRGRGNRQPGARNRADQARASIRGRTSPCAACPSNGPTTTSSA